ncbi:MAG: hypothetical protein ACRCUB_07655 [Plesiomonas shigelloides]
MICANSPVDECRPQGSDKKNTLWQLEPHICKTCFGRLASQSIGGGLRRYTCTNCGAESEARAADALCCCGIKIFKQVRGGSGEGAEMDAGIRCMRNPDPSPLFPNLFVASEVSE